MVSVVHVSRMVRRTVTLALLLITCVYAAPVPGKLTLVKNSSFGLGLAAGNSKTSGVVDNANKSVDIDVPGNTGENVPDVVLLEDVNSGAAVAIGDSLSLGVIKDSLLAGKNPLEETMIEKTHK